MAKVRFTKNELKRQKDGLKRFSRYLPTLKLKKQQLQSEIMKIRRQEEEQRSAIRAFGERVRAWAGIYADTRVRIAEQVKVEQVSVGRGNIAGIDIPVFERIRFGPAEYDERTTPLWVDAGREACEEMITLRAKAEVLRRQREKLQEELRVTVQRVNLFEKVKIPETRENIRKINIYLGDLQTAAVVRGKIAKAKIEKKKAGAPR
ncbi:MAG: V-type ATP synthase subunit D [Candidatus Omnitrophica bacterium]|nr:V-type ATP synthase subunit D [Candidatus Omnitrophota bacterium]